VTADFRDYPQAETRGAEASFNFKLDKGQIIEITRIGQPAAVYRVIDVHYVDDAWVWTYDLEPLDAAEREPDGA